MRTKFDNNFLRQYHGLLK